MKTFSGRKASQRESELRRFIDVLREEGVMRYLEIGARHGDTFHEVMCALPLGAYGCAIDLPGGAWGVTTSVKSLDAAAWDLRKRGYEVDVVYGDSRSPNVLNHIAKRAPFDAIFIDGDHRYEGVLADWTNYKPLARRIVAFHDIDGHGQTTKDGNAIPVGVPQLWEEIRQHADRWDEFVDREQRGMGIGVIYL